jgi:hypothetical protein
MGMQGLHDVFLVVRNGYCGRVIDHTGRENGGYSLSVATVVDGGAETLLAVRDGGDAGEAGGAEGDLRHDTAPFCLGVLRHVSEGRDADATSRACRGRM